VADGDLKVALKFFLSRGGGEIVVAPAPDKAPRPVLVVPFIN